MLFFIYFYNINVALALKFGQTVNFVSYKSYFFVNKVIDWHEFLKYHQLLENTPEKFVIKCIIMCHT